MNSQETLPAGIDFSVISDKDDRKNLELLDSAIQNQPDLFLAALNVYEYDAQRDLVGILNTTVEFARNFPQDSKELIGAVNSWKDLFSSNLDLEVEFDSGTENEIKEDTALQELRNQLKTDRNRANTELRDRVRRARFIKYAQILVNKSASVTPVKETAQAEPLIVAS
ncbi:MAG: hypothetical protein ACXWLH_00845 [Candidatus Saccharimonadales bacterium]